MKTNMTILAAILGLALSPAIRAEEKDHDHKEHAEAKKIVGPNKGRIVTATEPHFEFFVTADRKVKVTFVGDDGKVVAAKDQTVTAISGDRSSPVKMAFAKDGDSLVSDKALPEGNAVPVVLQVKLSADAKTVTEKFNVNLAKCPSCEHPEYACTCEHGGGKKEEGHEGHDH